MIIQESTELKEKFLKLLKERELPRSKGIHQSDLIYCLRKSLEPKEGWDELDEKRMVYFLVGNAEQRFLFGESPKEIEAQGIIFSLDAFGDNGIDWEVKSTRAYLKKDSSFEFPETWLRQIKGYCCVRNKTTMGIVVIHITQAIVRFYEVSFTEEELGTYWKWLLERRDTLKEGLKEGVCYGEKWEKEFCKSCPNQL